MAKHRNEGFKSRQLRRRMSVKTDEEFQILRDVLHTMLDEGELGWTKKRGYHLLSKKQEMHGILTLYKTHGMVELIDSKEQIYIDKKYYGTALNGDTVDVGIFAVKKKQNDSSEVKEGEVLHVVHRAQTEFIGTLERSKNFYFVLPDDPTMPRDIYVSPDSLNGTRPGEKVLVELTEWKNEHVNPEGKIIQSLGKAGDPFVELASVIHAYKLPTKFPREVEAEAVRLSPNISDKEIARRLDLRGLDIVTIDPVDAKDFDDALSLELREDGSYRLGVHIADVSAYVLEGTVLDEEAYNRGTSVYLANQVIPMLPEKLSNNICSLMPNVDRLAYSCIMNVTKKGMVQSYEFRRSVINSHRRFTYEEVEEILEKKKGEYSELLLNLWSLAKILRQKRMKLGSIDFDSPETKFHYDAQGKPDEILLKKRLQSHQLVEECMLLANQTAAKHISTIKTGKEELPFLYRVHDIPDAVKLKDLAQFVKKFGFSLNISNAASSKELQRLLEQVRGTKEENVINEVALRSMAKAVYSEKNIGHYGLAFEYYAHFTSPIRRYPDLLVHRLLDEYAAGMPPQRMNAWRKNLPVMAKWCSLRERVATEAERESVKVMQVEYMLQHIGGEFEGIISGVMQFGLFIELNGIHVEGLLHVRDLNDDYYSYDDKRYSLVGERRGKVFRLGDAITVQVHSVNPERRQIDFRYVESDIKEPTKKKKSKSKRK